LTIDDRSITIYLMKTEAKEKIIQAAFGLIHKKGFNSTGIQEILKTANVPKGSFYFYFQNKNDLGLQLIDYFLASIIFMADEALKTNKSPLEQLRLLFDQLSHTCEEADFQGGCLIGNLAQESGGLDDKFRVKLNEAFDVIQGKIKEFLQKAVSNKELPERMDVDEVAGFILSSFEGALLQMKVAKNTDPFRVFNHFIFEKVLK
jgi:TetR/AcrR family transcriptional regulator, transcriptional repressor for nem operon